MAISSSSLLYISASVGKESHSANAARTTGSDASIFFSEFSFSFLSVMWYLISVSALYLLNKALSRIWLSLWYLGDTPFASNNNFDISKLCMNPFILLSFGMRKLTLPLKNGCDSAWSKTSSQSGLFLINFAFFLSSAIVSFDCDELIVEELSASNPYMSSECSTNSIIN